MEQDFDPTTAPASDFRPDPDGRPWTAIHRDSGEPYNLGPSHPFFADAKAKRDAQAVSGDRKPTPAPFVADHTVNGVPAILIAKSNGDPAYYEVTEHGGKGKQLKHGGAVIVKLDESRRPEQKEGEE